MPLFHTGEMRREMGTYASAGHGRKLFLAEVTLDLLVKCSPDMLGEVVSEKLVYGAILQAGWPSPKPSTKSVLCRFQLVGKLEAGGNVQFLAHFDSGIASG